MGGTARSVNSKPFPYMLTYSKWNLDKLSDETLLASIMSCKLVSFQNCQEFLSSGYLTKSYISETTNRTLHKVYTLQAYF